MQAVVIRIATRHAPRVREILKAHRLRFTEKRPFPWLRTEFTVPDAGGYQLEMIATKIGFRIAYEGSVVTS